MLAACSSSSTFFSSSCLFSEESAQVFVCYRLVTALLFLVILGAYFFALEICLIVFCFLFCFALCFSFFWLTLKFAVIYFILFFLEWCHPKNRVLALMDLISFVFLLMFSSFFVCVPRSCCLIESQNIFSYVFFKITFWI